MKFEFCYFYGIFFWLYSWIKSHPDDFSIFKAFYVSLTSQNAAMFAFRSHALCYYRAAAAAATTKRSRRRQREEEQSSCVDFFAVSSSSSSSSIDFGSVSISLPALLLTLPALLALSLSLPLLQLSLHFKAVVVDLGLHKSNWSRSLPVLLLRCPAATAAAWDCCHCCSYCYCCWCCWSVYPWNSASISPFYIFNEVCGFLPEFAVLKAAAARCSCCRCRCCCCRCCTLSCKHTIHAQKM